MASTAAAYRNSDGAASGKTGHVFTREIVAGLLHLADVPPNLKTTLGGMWEAANRPHGREILFFAAVEGYRVEANWRCRRTVQRHLRRLEGLGIIELVHGSNTIRRPATYRLRTDRLGRRKSYLEAKAERRAHLVSQPTPRPDPPPDPEPSSPRPVQSAAVQNATPPTAAPRGETHRRITPRALRSGETRALGELFQRLLLTMKEYPPTEQALATMEERLRQTHHKPIWPDKSFQWGSFLARALNGDCKHLVAREVCDRLDRLSQELRGHGLHEDEVPNYLANRAPLQVPSTRREAVVLACQRLNLNIELAIEHLRGAGHAVDDGDPPGT